MNVRNPHHVFSNEILFNIFNSINIIYMCIKYTPKLYEETFFNILLIDSLFFVGNLSFTYTNIVIAGIIEVK